MNQRNVAIVQARMNSARFPGKMLAPLNGRPIVEWVLRRLAKAKTLDQIILATSDGAPDDVLADTANKLGVAVFRGSESDVLGRFAAAAREVRANRVIRVCADNPLIDPEEIDRLVDFFSTQFCDYACNHQDRLGSGYADGFGAEILSSELLEKIAVEATDPRHREHVTLYLWDHAEDFLLRAVPAPPALNFPTLRFDVDSSADLQRLQHWVEAGISLHTPASTIVTIATKHQAAPATIDHEISAYLHRLFPLCRSITGNPNRETLRVLQEIVPLSIHEVPSGSPVYDWTIPQEWNIRDAWIADSSGQRIVDFHANNLHVVSYSTPISGDFDWESLRSHLHRHPELPEAIPYRTSYYKRDWGFCVTHAQYTKLERLNGNFRVVIDSELKAGSLTYGELLLPGRSSQEILLSCYICHPSMANDSLSGVLLTAFLARTIASRRDRHWSYRIVFVPETIGAIAYCATNQAAMKQIDMGLVITTVGGPGQFGYKQSFDLAHPINAMIEAVLRETDTEFVTYPFDIHGSDERQYSSQGFGINMATICRDRYYEYRYYHSSLDDLSFVTGHQIEETLDIYLRLIERFEERRVYRNRIPHCEVMLSRHDLYPATGGAQRPELGGRSELDLILWLLHLCDGKLDIDAIAGRLGVTTEILEPIAERLVAKGTLEVI